MDIFIDVGNEEQQSIIKNELNLFEVIGRHLDFDLGVKKIIVTEEFDSTVNDILETEDYKSVRADDRALAKILPCEDGFTLVLSMELYCLDYQIRLESYLHEISHLFSKTQFPSVSETNTSNYNYLSSLNRWYDEYYANRNAFKMFRQIVKTPSIEYKRAHARYIKGFLETIKKSKTYKEKIRLEKEAFDTHHSVDTYLVNIRPYISSISLSLVYLFSHFDNSPILYRLEPILKKSDFYNESTSLFLNFLKDNYSANNFNLIDGIGIVKDYLAENYGFIYMDMPEGLWIRILEI